MLWEAEGDGVAIPPRRLPRSEPSPATLICGSRGRLSKNNDSTNVTRVLKELGVCVCVDRPSINRISCSSALVSTYIVSISELNLEAGIVERSAQITIRSEHFFSMIQKFS